MFIYKVRDVKTPTRGTNKSAGLDFYMPEGMGQVVIYPDTYINIPSGIKARIPEGFVLIAFNKSGIALNKKLMVGARVIDEDYQGEIHLHLVNSTKVPIYVYPGEKVLQFILLPVNYENVTVVESENELFDCVNSERGDGKFGSTGTE